MTGQASIHGINEDHQFAMSHMRGWPRLNLRSARDLGDVMANSARHTPLLPSGLPYAIVPPSGGRQDPGSGLSLISLLFDATQRMSTIRRRGTSRLERRGRSVDYIGRTAELIALISLSRHAFSRQC
ncbi:hypothetical protein C8J57DRAFT_1238534 [Mycena rebaudengoi]|nr:hypothetical protein C8J57DRAFT_1238534 [Mycena rebaudengoi]